MGLLPWWIGAVLLGALPVGFAAATSRPLGVSGMLTRALGVREGLRARRDQARLEALDEGAMAAQLAAARARLIEELGLSPEEVALLEAEDEGGLETGTAPPRSGPRASVSFLLALVAGGTLGAALLGELGLRTAAHPGLGQLAVGVGLPLPALLLAGGFAVGLGARVMGGCTMGHGLTGSGSLQPGSLLSTGVFFGTAVGLSSLLLAVGL